MQSNSLNECDPEVPPLLWWIRFAGARNVVGLRPATAVEQEVPDCDDKLQAIRNLSNFEPNHSTFHACGTMSPDGRNLDRDEVELQPIAPRRCNFGLRHT